MITQTGTDRYRQVIAKAKQLVKGYVVMLLATYASFTIIANLLGINQRGAAFLVSLGFFVIIIILLIHVIRMIKLSANLLLNNKDEKV